MNIDSWYIKVDGRKEFDEVCDYINSIHEDVFVGSKNRTYSKYIYFFRNKKNDCGYNNRKDQSCKDGEKITYKEFLQIKNGEYSPNYEIY